ncbi:MAG: glycogen synthase GlgA [Planctomycetia bacterium]|nr:glycogen synthase GlgA [Planctomycetia bacterium]
MNILIAASEAVPFAKTGGLADVCGAIPKALANLGHDVTLILPAYRCTKKFPTEPTGITFSVWIQGRELKGTYRQCRLPDSHVPVYLVEHDLFFDREGLYNQNNEDYGDNCERFVFFCYAVMEAIRLLDLKTDILHVNDWQTGLIPALWTLRYRDYAEYERIATMMTIHNMAYQGSFPAEAMSLTGLHWKYFNWLQMEFYDRLNLLKTGIVFADAITTVSPSYAREIQYNGGFGLEGVLRNRSDVLWGIANGIDTGEWNPQTDVHIPAHYSVENVHEGKLACKTALQQALGLPVHPDVPMVGFVGRLHEQKGVDLAVELIHRKAGNEEIQWVLLGSGDPNLEYSLRMLAAQYPHRVSVSIAYSNTMAHQIIAASDIFLMPSRFEPCGLTQLYSLRYGTIPVVHATGGLLDTVTDMTEETLLNHSATGIRFETPNLEGITWAMDRAIGTYRYNSSAWTQMMKTGMQTDSSWEQSAQKYVEIYQKIQRKVPAKLS